MTLKLIVFIPVHYLITVVDSIYRNLTYLIVDFNHNLGRRSLLGDHFNLILIVMG